MRKIPLIITGLFLTLTLQFCNAPDKNNHVENQAIQEIIARSANDIIEKDRLKKQRFDSIAIGNDQIESAFLSVNGTQIDIKEFEGKLLVMDFWATWCAPCIEEIPIIYEKAKKYKGQPVEFVIVSIDDEKKQWKEFVSKKNWIENSYWIGGEEQNNPLFWYTYTEVEDNNSKIIIIALPKYIIVSKNGKIVNNFAPKPRSEEFDKLIDANLL